MEDKSKKTGFTFTLDYRVLVVFLLVVIAAMVAIWQPWNRQSDRTIEVTGEATVSAVPDEFVFTPYYEFTGSDKTALLADLSKKSEEVVAKLKDLGVADEKIKTNSGGYDYPIYRDSSSNPTYTLSLTITIDNKDLAQKVQDYLVTTTPLGSVAPQASFSDKKRNEVESTARDEAAKDARAKAEQSAKNLGASIGSVKTVTDGAGFGPVYLNSAQASDATMESKLTIQPGENDLSYTVTVTYYLQ